MKKQKQKKVVRVTYKMMYGFLQTLPEDFKIDLGSTNDCLCCQTVKKLYNKSVHCTEDHLLRKSLSFFSTFVSREDNNTFYVVPDKFAKFCENTCMFALKTVQELKAELRTMCKKSL